MPAHVSLMRCIKSLVSRTHAEACLTGWPNAQPREETNVVLRDTIRLTWWCVWCVVVARPLLIKRCVWLRKGSGLEIPCAMIFTLLGLTTVSMAANTYCMMNGFSSCAPRTVGPRVQFSGACEQSHWWPARAYSRRPSVISGSSSD